MTFACPLCQVECPVVLTKTARLMLRCDPCGVLMFVNKEAGIEKLKDLCGGEPPEGVKPVPNAPADKVEPKIICRRASVKRERKADT